MPKSLITIPPRIIVALDYSSQREALNFARQVDPALCRVKVGKELFAASGPAVVEALHQLGFEVFLDLKFHDIPHTVFKACRAVAELGVWMLSLHTSGGGRMLQAAQAAVSSYDRPPLLVGVTVLTSFTPEELGEIGIADSMDKHVMRLACLAEASGLAGLVCSADEVAVMRAYFPQMILVTPGIRLAHGVGSPEDDQRRIATPLEAIQRGSDYLVIGRPITQSESPLKDIKLINCEIN